MFNTLSYISTQTTTTLATGSVQVHTITFPIAATGAVTLTDTAGTSYAVFSIGAVGTMILDCVFPNGLKVVTAAADKVLVSYSQ